MAKSKKQLISEANKREIFWNIVNSILAGSLVFLGSLTAGSFSLQGLCAAIIASLVVGVSKFREYWSKEESEYSKNYLFNFVN